MTNPTDAKALLADAVREPDRFRRHWLTAAAITSIARRPPVVVGGTAEQYWARDEYRETDLDLCGGLYPDEIEQLREFGFEKVGRYWELDGEFAIAVEFPEETLAGDQARVVVDRTAGQPVHVIGVDDLYLDRLRQATARPGGDPDRLAGAFALLATRAGEMDFAYVERCIAFEIGRNPLEPMRSFHRALARGIRERRTFEDVLRRLRNRRTERRV